MTANGSPTPTVRRRTPATPCAAPYPAALSRSAPPHAEAVLRGLQSSSSPMFGLAVQVYRSHQRDGEGRCQLCARRACRSWAHAATIIAAAGITPAEVVAHPRCRFTSRRRPWHLTAAGSRSYLRVNGARVVRSRLSPEDRGRIRLSIRSTRSRWDRPLSHEPALALRLAHPPAAKPVVMHSELVQTARSANAYPLSGLLYCRCGAAFCRWGTPEAKRQYMTVCGCRLRPIDADLIERRVYADATRLDPARPADGGTATAAEVLAGLYARIELGGTVDDVLFVPPT